MNTRYDELDMEREIAKVEVKDLRTTVQNNLKLETTNSSFKQAVKVFRQTITHEWQSEQEDESKLPDASGDKRIVIRRKKKTPKVKRKRPTYWHPEVALEELDQALNDVAVLQGELLQLKTVNKELQAMYNEAEVKHTIAQYKISKLEKTKRELILEKSSIDSQAVLKKLSEKRNTVSFSSTSPRVDKPKILDNDDERSLLNSSKVGDLTTVNILCDQSAKKDDEQKHREFVNCRNNDGWTPLMLASARGHLPVVQKLLAFGGDVKLIESDLGYTALHLAAWNNRENIVKYLIQEAKCSPDPEGEYKRTPLMLAANWGASGTLRILLDLGANPLQKDSRGRTAIHWARDKAIKSALEEAMKKAENEKNKSAESSNNELQFHKNVSDVENEV